MLSNIFQQFHFEQPLWLWALVAVPVIWVLYRLFYSQSNANIKLTQFADSHLLPHLLKDEQSVGQQRRTPIFWTLLTASIIWCLGVMAMAGPMWDFKEAAVFKPTDSLLVLLDLSKSMDAQDVKPSRLIRAQQEIQDIEQTADGVNIGLIAFASVPHVITPLTDDKEALLRLLPSLKTNLVYSQGSNLVPALKRAGEILSSQEGNEKHILVISDGDFSDSDASIFQAENELKKQGVKIHFMGVGTEQGAPIPDEENGYIKDQGKTVISELEQHRLQTLSQDIGGQYLRADYLDNDTAQLLAQITPSADTVAQQKIRTWQQRFYIFLLPLMVLALFWFRRGAAITTLLICISVFHPYQQAQAADLQNLFLNSAQQGKKALEDKDYQSAINQFSDPYRRGVAEYKAGQYKQAAASFSQAQRESVQQDAKYNLGNAQLMSGQIDAAINTYESLLKQTPNNKDAQYNLEIAKKLRQQQQSQQNKSQQDKSQQNKSQQDKSQQDKSQQDKSQQDKSQQDKSQQDKSQQDKSQQDKSQQDKSQQDKSQQDKSQQDKSQQDKSQQDKSQQDKSQQDKSQQDKSQQDKSQQDKSQQDKSQQDKSQQDKSQQDKSQQDKSQQDKSQQDKSQQDKSQQDKQQQQSAEMNKSQQEQSQKSSAQQKQRSEKDINADQWLNRIKDDPEQFLKNKFYIESQRQGAEASVKPW
ncbi:VWA domain-containing protein [Methylophaga sulfidovorans]|uniref:Ca-activated chloride channel family protein n=1 Tax=Methylophaga sulfidovorans TaxID=45496 RepID=A0A1I3XGB3_9GAMM|nr:VWA domain-containing protein [Methylophaga sulfidovorans]SFK18111.1 Ca-activated chloride channel family protein [Methylophaga sulfidovorans]